MAYVTGVNSGNLQVMPTAARMPALNYSALDLGDQNARIAGGLAIGRDISEYGKNRANELALQKAKIEAAQALAKQQQVQAEKVSATVESEKAATIADNTLDAASKTQKLQILEATDKQAKSTALANANVAEQLSVAKEKLTPTTIETDAVKAGTENVQAKGVAKRLPVTESIEDLGAESQRKIVADINESGFSSAPGGKYVSGPKGPTFVADKINPAGTSVSWGKAYKNESTGQWEQQGELADGRVTTKVVAAPKIDSTFSPKDKKAMEDYSAFGYKADVNAAADLNTAAEFYESDRPSVTDTGIVGGLTSAMAEKISPKLGNLGKSEEAKNASMLVKEFGASKLKQAFGGQLSDGEREFLMQTLEDPTASAATKAKRFRVLAQRMIDYSTAKKAQTDYFTQNGSLEGFTGTNPDEIKNSVTSAVSGVRDSSGSTQPSQGSQKGSSTTVVELNDNAKVVSGRPAAKKLSAPAYNSLDELTAAYKAGKITPEDARNLAISNGWAK